MVLKKMPKHSVNVLRSGKIQLCSQEACTNINTAKILFFKQTSNCMERKIWLGDNTSIADEVTLAPKYRLRIAVYALISSQDLTDYINSIRTN